MANFHKATSHLQKTPIKEFYLDIWEGDSYEILPTLDDTEYTIESKYHRRPDLLAHDLYGDSRLWWRFVMRNKDLLIDPINDFNSGLVIWIPSKV